MAKDKPAKYWRFKLDTRRKFTELSQEIARINSGGGADIDLTEYATKVWVEAKGYITASALTPYALKTDIPSLVGYATENFVNNKLQNYTTTEDLVENYASKSDLESAINGIDLSAYLLKADLTKSRIQSTLGISDWALAATKPSYAWSEITSRPTALSQFTDDVVAGKYLPLSGGTLSNAVWRSQLTIERSGSTNDSVIAFTNSNGLLGCLGYRGADSIPCVWLGETDTGVPIIHANNIGGYNAGSANILQALSNKYYVTANTRDDNWKVALKIGGWQSQDAGFSTTYGTVVDIAGFNTWYHRLAFNTNGEIEHWMGINTFEMSRVGYLAYLTSNVASATKLQTPRSIWGKSFDGTADVSGSLYSDIWRIIKDSTHNGTFIQSANYDGTSDIGNIYISARNDNKLTSFNVWANNSKFTNNIEVGGSINNVLNAQKGDSVTAYLHITNVYSTIDYVSIYVSNLDNSRKDRPLVLQNGYGNVGIGSSSPTEKLDVAGNIKASGNINATSITINGVTITASNGSITVNGNVLATGAITSKKVG